MPIACWIVIMLLVLGRTDAVANLYHWTDSNGIRHFSNTPPPEGVQSVKALKEIPYDPESDNQRREREDALLQEREAAQNLKRLEDAERNAAEARRQADAARRKAKRLERELEELEDDRSYGVIYRGRRPGQRPPGGRPPGHRPPGHRPPGWKPKPEPYQDKTPKPSADRPQNQPRGKGDRGRSR